VTRSLGIEKSPPSSERAAPARLERSSTGLRRSAEAASKPRPTAEPAAEPAAESASIPAAPAALPIPAPEQPQPSSAKKPAPAALAEAPAPSAAIASRPIAIADPAHDLYRSAHRAHFVEHNPTAALALWEAYLREAPRGRFAVEARYNRALCLVRLRRHAEARAALQPFAEGAVGGYRQREAAELLEALGK
jgi:hypothetical protein